MLFTAYAIVRTVPSANRPNRRKKQNPYEGLEVIEMWCPWVLCLQTRWDGLTGLLWPMGLAELAVLMLSLRRLW